MMGKETGIIYRQWNASSPKGVFLLVHGLGAHTGRWEFLADFFLENDISSYALALKGFGETKGPRGHIDSFNIYFNDIRSLYDVIVKENAGRKIFLLGESLGALIAFLMAIREPGLFNGLICISPAFKSRMKLAPLEYLKIFLPLIYDPKKEVNMPFTSQMCTRDIDYQKVMDSDEKEYRSATSKLLFEIVRAQLRGNMLKGRLNVPVLFLLSGEDKLTDSEVSRKVFQGLKAEDKSMIEYPDMYHALTIDLGREDVFKDILKWVQERTVP